MSPSAKTVSYANFLDKENTLFWLEESRRLRYSGVLYCRFEHLISFAMNRDIRKLSGD